MAGIIHINEKRSWSVANWVFDHVMSLARNNMPGKDSSKIIELIDKSSNGLRYIPLDQLTSTEIALFLNALEKGYSEMRAKGENSFTEPQFFPGFMERLKELLEMVRELTE